VTNQFLVSLTDSKSPNRRLLMTVFPTEPNPWPLEWLSPPQ